MNKRLFLMNLSKTFFNFTGCYRKQRTLPRDWNCNYDFKICQSFHLFACQFEILLTFMTLTPIIRARIKKVLRIIAQNYYFRPDDFKQ